MEGPCCMVSMDSSSTSRAWVALAGAASSSVRMKWWLVVLLPGREWVPLTVSPAAVLRPFLWVLRPRQR